MLLGIVQQLCLLHLFTAMDVGHTVNVPLQFQQNQQKRFAGCNTCAEYEDCRESNKVCRNGLCECDYGYVMNGYICQPAYIGSGALGGSCYQSQDCQTTNTRCVDSACDCLPTFIRVDNLCLPMRNHNGLCEHRVQCGEHQYCGCDGRCTCLSGYVFDGIQTYRCLPIRSMDEDCDATVQCNYDNAECFHELCTCDPTMGVSIDGQHCVAMTMDFIISIELSQVTYTFQLLNRYSSTYKDAVAAADGAIRTITFHLEMNGIKVESCNVHNFTKNALSDKANATIALRVYNPEYRTVTNGFRSLGKRSITDNQRDDRTVRNLESLEERIYQILAIDGLETLPENVKQMVIKALEPQETASDLTDAK